MSLQTGIAWTDSTWTPIRARRRDTGKVGVHCEKVSAGCKSCYSETFNRRTLPNQGTGLDFMRPNREKVEIFVDEKILAWPLHWKKPRRIFVCSQTDLFAEFVTDEQILRVWSIMATAGRAGHVFQVLTKRPERMARLVPELNEQIARWSDPPKLPLPWLWLGISCEDQVTADERIPLLLRTPAAVRFVSAEPLLGPINLREMAHRDDFHVDALDTPDPSCRVSWVIVGGESGAKARPCNLAWIRSLRDQCKAAGVACFVKQFGARIRLRRRSDEMQCWPALPRLVRDDGPEHCVVRLDDAAGAHPAEWPEDLRIQEFPA